LAHSEATNQWVELSVYASVEAVDAIAEVFRAHGVAGIAVEPAIQPAADEGSRESNVGPRILAYLPVTNQVEAREREIEQALWHLTAFDLAPVSEVSKRLLAEEDWANAWKEHFHPLRIGRNMVIKPSWREVQRSPADVVIELDPGMAFGTGLHPTTRMVLEAMESFTPLGSRVLDLGTGSGILAVAAAKLGAAHVLAADVDPLACAIASENARLNHVEDVVRVAPGSAEVAQGTYDLILANIIASVIADLAPEFRRLMGPKSRLIASGIVEERAHLVEAAFQAAGLVVVETRRSDDWLCQVVVNCPL